jgi:hypothetical protein
MTNKNTQVSLWFLVIAFVVLAAGGCVNRKLTINTVPQGGLVILNDEEIGIAPVTVGFSWYGDYRVRVEKQGYDTLKTHRDLKAPLHDRFPFDFFAEVLWPGQINDEYEWTFELLPYQPIGRTELIDSAGKMRQRAADEIAAAVATSPMVDEEAEK